jgi:undecaprenyl-diphosphatase
MSLLQASLLGLLQGITELFPISSLGHTVILPKIFGWDIDQSDPSFLIFLVATHFATALVLFAFFWRDWFNIIFGMLRSLRDRKIRAEDTYAKIGWLLVVATIPAGILGLLFQDYLKALFATPRYSAMFLIGNGILLFAAEMLRRRRSVAEIHDDAQIAALSWSKTVGVGFMQSLALLPGFSRTGATLSGGLLSGLSHQDAARFAFLLATPIIFAAAVLKVARTFQCWRQFPTDYRGIGLRRNRRIFFGEISHPIF